MDTKEYELQVLAWRKVDPKIRAFFRRSTVFGFDTILEQWPNARLKKTGNRCQPWTFVLGNTPKVYNERRIVNIAFYARDVLAVLGLGHLDPAILRAFPTGHLRQQYEAAKTKELMDRLRGFETQVATVAHQRYLIRKGDYERLIPYILDDLRNGARESRIEIGDDAPGKKIDLTVDWAAAEEQDVDDQSEPG